MKVFTMKELARKSGWMILLYSETGVGKTATSLLTAPDPIAYIQTEPRSLKPTLDVVKKYRPKLRFKAFMYEDISDLLETLAEMDTFKDYTTLLFDGFSFLMNVSLAAEVTAEAYEARSEDEKKKKPLAGLTKMTMEGQGVRNQLMFRVTNLLMKYAQIGKIVICTALLMENPKWNRSLAAAPALSAREFPTNMPGFFDLIGKLETNYKKIDDGYEIIYPPIVRFESPEDDFICKFTGAGDKRVGALHIDKILKANK